MSKFYDLVAAVKSSNYTTEEQTDILKIIRSDINSFIDYFNQVVEMELLAESGFDSASMYMYKSMDETRRQYHDICVESCEEINQMCEKLGIDKICDFDISDRHEVAKFCGYIVSGIYAKGINEEKSFDKLVMLYASQNERAQRYETLEDDQLTI